LHGVTDKAKTRGLIWLILLLKALSDQRVAILK